MSESKPKNLTLLGQSQLILDSLLNSQLLVQEIGGIPAFDRDLLNTLTLTHPLKFEQKLGHLYEDALELLFRSSIEFKQVCKGVQVIENLPHPQKGNRTLGEFDYLLQRQDGRWLHVELAVKFYLGTSTVKAESTDNSYLWPGPDARDAWERKHQHMINCQFSLAKQSASQQVLQEICGTTDIQSQHLIYGCLFDRYNSTEPQTAVDTSPTAHRGYWMHSHELPNSALAQQQSLYIIPKQLWPCVPTAELCQVLKSSNQQTTLAAIQTKIQQQQRCVMITDGIERYFIAPNYYPEVKPL